MKECGGASCWADAAQKTKLVPRTHTSRICRPVALLQGQTMKVNCETLELQRPDDGSTACEAVGG